MSLLLLLRNPPAPAAPSAAQIATWLAGGYGPIAGYFRFYQTNRLGEVIAEITDAVVAGAGSITFNNDNAVCSTLRTTLIEPLLPSGFVNATAANCNVQVVFQGDILGYTYTFPLGIYWIDRASETDTQVTRLWEVEGSDLSNVLAVGTTPTTYVVSAGADYFAAINAIITTLGLVSDLSPSSSYAVPVDFSWAPDTSWLTIINDLLDGLTWYRLFPGPTGHMQARAMVQLASETIAAHYDGNTEPIMAKAPLKRPARADVTQAINQVTAAIDDPLRTATSVTANNADASSAISQVSLGSATYPVIRRSALTGNSGMKCAYNALALQGRVWRELEFADARSLPGELHTLFDPRRGGREFYTVSVADQRGGILSSQVERCVEWTLPLAIGGEMTHRIEQVNVLVMT